MKEDMLAKLNPTQKKYYDFAVNEANKKGLDPALFTSLLFKESNLMPFDKAGNPKKSYTGAVGIAQIQPNFYPKIPINELINPETAIGHAADILKGHFDKYDDARLAIAAYNGGNGGAQYLKEHPEYFAKPDTTAPIEKWRHQTADYVNKIFTWSGHDPSQPLDLKKKEIDNAATIAAEETISPEELQTKPVMLGGVEVPGLSGIINTIKGLNNGQ